MVSCYNYQVTQFDPDDGALVMSTDMLRRLTNRRFIIIINIKNCSLSKC